MAATVAFAGRPVTLRRSYATRPVSSRSGHATRPSRSMRARTVVSAAAEPLLLRVCRGEGAGPKAPHCVIPFKRTTGSRSAHLDDAFNPVTPDNATHVTQLAQAFRVPCHDLTGIRRRCARPVHGRRRRSSVGLR